MSAWPVFKPSPLPSTQRRPAGMLSLVARCRRWRVRRIRSPSLARFLRSSSVGIARREAAILTAALARARPAHGIGRPSVLAEPLARERACSRHGLGCALAQHSTRRRQLGRHSRARRVDVGPTRCTGRVWLERGDAGSGPRSFGDPTRRRPPCEDRGERHLTRWRSALYADIAVPVWSDNVAKPRCGHPECRPSKPPGPGLLAQYPPAPVVRSWKAPPPPGASPLSLRSSGS